LHCDECAGGFEGGSLGPPLGGAGGKNPLARGFVGSAPKKFVFPQETCRIFGRIFGRWFFVDGFVGMFLDRARVCVFVIDGNDQHD
jgi:hypothetical protein